MNALAGGTRDPDQAAARRAGIWVLAYLALPNLIFMAGWLRPEFGWPAALAVALACGLLGRGAWRPAWPAGAPGAVGRLAQAGAWALVWLLLSGTGHLVYANSDWLVRDAVLADLIGAPWPVVYHSVANFGDLLLRAPLGIYLPAALVGKLLGPDAGLVAFFLWCLLGLALVTALLARGATSQREVASRLLVFVLFSGMDIVGSVLSKQLPVMGGHIEWWAGLFQYSSHTTQLFWVPNHALPGWLVVAWLLGMKRGALPTGLALALIACVPLWSPLTAIGLAPLLLVAGIDALRAQGARALLQPAGLVVALVLAGLVFPYLLLAGQALPFTMATGHAPPTYFWERYVEFVLLEFLPLGVLLLLRDRRDPLVWTAVLVLLLLPLVRFGPYNDLAMRASIPALAVLAIRMGTWFAERWSQPGGAEDTRASFAMLLFAIGALTPLLEFSRVLVLSPWAFNPQRSVIATTGGNAPHYLAPVDQEWVRRMLRQP